MTVIHRITVWLIPSILLWGGCAAPALKTASTLPLEATAEVPDEEPSGPAGASPSRMVAAEAALIRQTALERGFSQEEADRIEESVLDAQPQHREFLTRYIHALNRYHEAPSTGEEASEADASPNSADLADQSVHLVTPATRESVDERPIGSATATPHSARLTDEPPAPDASVTLSRPRPTSAPPTQIEMPDEETATGDRAVHPAGRGVEVSADETPASVVGPGSLALAAHRPSHTPALAGGQVEDNSAADNSAADNSAADADATWQRQLRGAIVKLREDLETREYIDPLDETRLRACLSLLQLAADDPDRAMETLEGFDDQQLEFWRQTIMGLGILVNPEELPKMRYRVESAVEHLDSGYSALAALGPLRVTNLAFVREVRSFGVYEEIGSRGFRPGEETILYVEISNFQVEEILPQQEPASSRRHAGPGEVPLYEAELQGRYEVLDPQQRVVVSRTLPVLKDQCRQRRRDFFGAYTFFIPKIEPGDYVLELTIEDKKGGKFGSGSIDFRVR